jgi:hypothetical protein
MIIPGHDDELSKLKAAMQQATDTAFFKISKELVSIPGSDVQILHVVFGPAIWLEKETESAARTRWIRARMLATAQLVQN